MSTPTLPETPSIPPPLDPHEEATRKESAVRAQALVDKRAEEQQYRVTLGKSIGLVGFLVIAAVLTWTAVSVHSMGDELRGVEQLGYGYAILASHTAVSVAGLYLGYSLLRMAERLLLPRWMTSEPGVDVELVKTLLGVRSPARLIARQVENTTKTLVELLQSLLATLRQTPKG